MAIFDVRDFGATSDDASDDSAAIPSAIDAAFAAGGGTVYIPTGTFLVSGDPTNPSAGCVEVRSNVTLTGAGIGSSILKLVDNFDERINGIVRTPVDESASNVVISNLTIDGNRANNIGHQAGIITGVKANDEGRVQENITISGVEVKDCTAYGVDPHEVTYNLTVEDCVAHGNGLDGFVADDIVGGVFRDNIAYDNDRHGFNITTSSTNILLENDIAYGNGTGATGGAGLVVQRSDIFPEGEDTVPWPSQISIVGGQYYDNSSEGVLIKLSDQVTMTGASIHDNARQGVRVEGATDTVIHDNTIYNNSQEANGVYDEINIRLRLDDAVDPARIYYAEDTSVYNNTIYEDQSIRGRYGIREELTNSTATNPSGTVVHDNTVTGTTAGDVFIPPYSATERDDYFYGTSSGDVFAGLGGNDTYIVNHTSDQVIEAPHKGVDTVIASLNHTLAANVEDLLLTGSAIRGTGNELDNVIIGNNQNNELEGLAGSDALDGGVGADLMQGGDGNDIYYVDNPGDVIVEMDHSGLGGIDTVYSTISYTLTAEVEKLVLQGGKDLNVTGNVLANELVGNSGNNILDGQAGADTMRGGVGDDTYVVDHTGDVVIELPGEGNDTVKSSLTYTLGDNVENLVLIGTATRDGTGNALANVIVGNAGANILHGLGGDDTIEGGLGADHLYGDGGNDVFVLRKGEFAGDVIEDFTGNGTAVGDTILLKGFSAAATLVDIGSGNWVVRDGTYEEAFRIKIPVGQSAVTVHDYSFDGASPVASSAPVPSSTGNTANGIEDTVLNGVLPSGSDPNGDGFSYALVGTPAGVTLNPNGNYSFTPAANANGNFAFQYKLVDTHGTESSPQTFTISVAPVNDAPVAAIAGNLASGSENTTITGVVPAGSDVDGGTLAYAQVGSLAGLAFKADGTFSFTPPAHASGDYVFQYKVVDTAGAESVAQHFTITVAPVNEAPSAATTGNTASGNEDTVISGILPPGSDPDGDALKYALVGTPAHVILDAAGHFSYTPPANANGDFVFQYKLIDPSGLESAPQTFTVSVAPVNDAPVASEFGNAITGNEGSIINGGVPAGTDVDSSHLTYSLASTLSGLVLHADGTFSFTPAGSGDYSFQYKVVDDGGGQSAAHAFTISVAHAVGLTINGTSGGDALFGGSGNDIIDGRQGGDKMYGYAGDDTYYVDSSKDKLFEAVGGGHDTVLTSASFTIGQGVEIEFVQATGTSSVSLKGNDWANTLVGNSAANTLTGNGGDDVLDGGLGKDTLTGGTGKDQFVFSTALGPNNIDAVKDFKVVDDTIALDRSVFAALSEGVLHQSDFVRGTQATHASDHMIYDSTGGRLLYDADGAGGADAIVFATIGKNLSIDYLDFLILDNHLS
jgi:Ca2+-binding RTX toxin-like protein